MTRFRSSEHEDPPSLYYKSMAEGVVVASEPLDMTHGKLKEWKLLGKDKMLSYHPDEGIQVDCLSEICTEDVDMH